MQEPTGNDLNAAFEAEELERTRTGGLAAVRVGVPVFLLFALYDVFFFPEHAALFIAMRLVVTTALLAAYLQLRKPGGARWVRPIAYVACVLAASTIIAMTVVTGGRASPYYGGVNLILLAVTLLVPWPPAWSMAASGTLLVGYAGTLTLTRAYPDPGMLIHNLCYLGGTAAFGYWTSVVQRQARWLEFTSRIAHERALAAKSDFLASMSHELRSPLHVIIGYAQMLLDHTGTPDELAGRIHDRGVYLHGLISDLLDVSKIDAGHVDVHPVSVALGPMVERIATSFAPIAAQKALLLETSIAADDAAIATDPMRVEQILVNLIANAVKFTQQGRVHVSVGRLADATGLLDQGYLLLGDAPPAAGPVLAVAVSDTGIGIRPEDLGSLAEDFRQLDDATRGNFGGTGLGLSVSRKVAALLGGAIAVRSTYGSGSTFVLVLPARHTAARVAA